MSKPQYIQINPTTFVNPEIERDNSFPWFGFIISAGVLLLILKGVL